MTEILRWHSLPGPGELFHIARTRITEGQHHRHSHDFPELFWVEEGAGVHFINGADLPLQVGDLICIRPSDVHQLAGAPETSLQIVNVAFPVSVLACLADRHGVFSEILWPTEPKLPAQFALPPSLLEHLHKEAVVLADHRDALLALERFLLDLAWQLRPQGSAARASDAPRWLRDAVEQMRLPAHLAGGVGTLVALAGRSHEHVARMVRRHYGQTPGELVRGLRLTYASSRLVLTDRTISDIASRCGYASVPHFHAVFKACYGETPHAYRRRHHALTTQ